MLFVTTEGVKKVINCFENGVIVKAQACVF